MCARARRRLGTRSSARQHQATPEIEPARRPAPAADHGARPGVPLFLKALPETAPASSDAASRATRFAEQDAGHPLDGATRSTMEAGLGHDLGGVRVHTSAEAADAASHVAARAYTTGSDVVFGDGEYAPSTTEGQRLLAHELTHVVQQSAAPTHIATTAEPSVSQPSDPLERAADRVADEVASGGHTAPAVDTPDRGSVPTRAIQRQARPIELFPPSALRPETPTEKMKRILEPIPEAAPGPTISQAVLERMDRALNKTMERLGVSDAYRPYVRAAAHAALEGGVAKLRDMALDQLKIGEEGKEALRNAATAAVQTPTR
jgi:hypothetical protein